MASSRKISVGFILVLIGVFCFINVSLSSVNDTHPRLKRQECQDGTYEHEGTACCLCSAGQRVKVHCTSSQNDGQCEFCTEGTYNSEPNSKESCEPCTSCSHENANLEEVERCTRYQDTKCRCKAHHYCSSATGTCKICQPCDKCEATGFKEHCTATSNAVCNETKGLGGGAVAGIVIVLLLLLLVAVGVFIKRKSIMELLRPNSDSPNSSNHVDDPLLTVDMEPHLADVAEILGWKDMRQIALRSQMVNAVEHVQASYPNDSEMWTIEILKQWSEKTGITASGELIRLLRTRGKNSKADKIRNILTGSSTASQNHSV